MGATDFLKNLSEDELRRKLHELEAERKATMVLLRAVRARQLALGDEQGTQVYPSQPQPRRQGR